jgi:DNA invertase Pin-like site-specific DNA recombinase
VFLYSRVSTSAQTLEQQERTVYEWLKNHNMTVDEVISDEGVSGGVSYADRKLGKELIPRMKEGDALIVSEVSRLGRSMFDLSKLIHDELKPRKLRLIVVGMGIDLNCAKITPIDQLILSNFSFAAELEKHLIRERTLSALQVKRQQGVKFGSASEKYRENYNNKSSEEKVRIARKKGLTKSVRYFESRDIQAFVKVLRKTFPEYCEGKPWEWVWESINTKRCKRIPMLETMRDFHEIDPNLFRDWDLSDIKSTKLQYKLSNILFSLKRTVNTLKENNYSIII